MAIQYTASINLTTPTGTITSQLTASGDNNLEQNLTIASSASSAETDLTITESTLQAILLLAPAAMTCVFKTGTGGSGTTVATITLVANVPYIWVYGNGTNPFTGNAGQVLVTSTAGGLLQIRALMQT